MEISKDVFLTDNRAPYLSLVLASRDLAAHRLLTGLTDGEREDLHRTLADSAAAVRQMLRTAWTRLEADATTSSFGCGT